MDNTYDVIVVGAGPGGTTAASLLANAGKRVLLVDKNQKPGGRMMTINRDGFAYELFPINCVPQHNSLFEKLSRILGKEDQVKVILADEFGGMGKIIYEDSKGNIRSWSTGPNQLQMLGLFGVKWYHFRSIIQIIRVFGKMASMKPAAIDSLYDISAMDYINSLGKLPPGVYTYLLATFGEGMFEMTSDRVAAGEMVKMFQQAMKGSGGRYYEGGIGRFFEVMAKTVEEKNGGAILMGTRTASINIKDGRVRGITTTEGKNYTAPVVISNAGIRQTILKLVGEQHFDPSYTDKIRKYENNLACVGYRFFINKPLLKDPTIVLFPEGCVSKYEEFEKMARGEITPEKGYIYFGTTSLYPNCAPDGKQVVYAVVSCAPDPKLDPAPYLKYIDKGIQKVIPELYSSGCIEKTEIMSPANVPSVGNDVLFEGQGGESYGIANSLGQAGKDRPKGDTPIDGLYIVGNDAGGSGLGTHQAVDSGFNIFEMVMEREFR
jgi:prolycopene isomerase